MAVPHLGIRFVEMLKKQRHKATRMETVNIKETETETERKKREEL